MKNRMDWLSGRRAVLLAGVCSLAAGGYAHAQSAASGPAAPVSRTAEVVVTARRRAEPLSKTPMTITAISGTQLIQQGITNANQLQFATPSLTVSQGRQGVELTIRGVTTTDTSTKGEPDIAFNIDGVPNLRSEEQALSFFDLTRVEVLNGPQSTLYGVASTGGDINLITNPPTFTQAASATFEVGNYDTRRVQAMINQPINDILAFRGAIDFNQRDGYVTLIGGERGDDPADEDNFSRRVSLLARFNSDFTVRLTETGGTLGGNGQYTSLPLNVTGSGGTLIAHPSPFGWANIFQGHENDHWDMPNLQLDDGVGPVHIGFVSNYNYYHEDTTTPDYQLEPAFSALPASADPETIGGANNGGRFWIRERYQTYFNELRLSNQDPDDRIEYIAGVNYLWQQNNEDGHGWEIYPAAPVPLNPDYSTTDEPVNTTTQTSFSIFAHTITRLTDQLRLTLGVRQSWDRDDRVGSFAIGEGFGALWPNIYGTPCTGLQSCIGLPDSGSQKSNAFTYNTGLDYQITPTQMVYVSYSKGYKPGGFNDPSPGLPNGTAPYGPEKIFAYEAGYKLSLPAGIRLSTDVYYYDYKAEQINEQVPGGLEYTLLKPTTEYGSESTATYPVTPNDVLEASADFEHGWFDNGNGAITRWVLSNLPPWVIGGGYSHYWTMADGGQIKIHAATRWSSSYVEDDIGDFVQFKQPSFTRTNADLTYITPNGKFTTEAFVENIENKVQITNASEGVSKLAATANDSITTPRFWGVRETVKF